MRYRELLNYLYTLTPTRTKSSLDHVRTLNREAGCPDRNFKSIHVAGSNGKGSVATKIAKGLQLAGKKVGLFTSPHISTFRERIQINGVYIQRKDIEELLPPLLDIVSGKNMPATFFDITTVLAFSYFARQQVDYAIIEVGLGGRLDATNIITPCAAIITSISLEHTEILGKSLAEITLEKAGIFKPGIPAFVGPRVPTSNIQTFTHSLVQIKGSFNTYDQENSAIAAQVLRSLNIDEMLINEGIQARPPCRLELIPGKIPIILDVAHNPDGFSQLMASLKEIFPCRKIRAVCAFSNSKDIESCLSALIDATTEIHITEAAHERAAKIRELQDIISTKGLRPCSINPSVKETVHLAQHLAELNDEILLICGTFFMMAEARAALGVVDETDQ